MLTGIPTPTPTELCIRRGEQALALRHDGLTYREIGVAFGVSKGRARQIVRRACNRHWSDTLPGRVRTFLHNMDWAALSEPEAAIAVARLSRRELLAAPNIGRAACDAVLGWLARFDLTLRSP
jgi:hypothetical protein